MSAHFTGHADTFAEDSLPPPEQMPDLHFERRRYPDRINAAAFFLDDRIQAIGRDRRCLLAPGSRPWSYGDLLDSANRIARVLVEDLGVISGNRVLLRAPNTPMLAACWFAILKAGGIAVTTMPLYRAGELRFMMDKASVTHALCDVRMRDELELACAQYRGVRVVHFNDASPSSLDSLMGLKPTNFANVVTAAEDIALIAFTSGTTGPPKAAMHYHRDLLAICDTYCAKVLQPNAEDLFCGSPPLGFTFGLGGLLLFPMFAGAATLLLERAGPTELLRAIATEGVTTVFTAPLAYRAMADAAHAHDLSSLRRCVSAGEALPKAVWERWQTETGLRILDGIGSTEMLHIFVGSPEWETRAGSTGRAVPGYVAEIHDESGTRVPPGTVGRLAVKGPTGCKYLSDERQTTYVREGWNYPGDAYWQDGDGYFFHVARVDDMIVSAGYNISGPEVEQALIAHAHVREVAVVGKRDAEKATNYVKAFVVLADGCEPNGDKASELQEFCKTQIAPFKAPREIEFVAALPRTQTGKLQRYKLRAP